MLGVYISGSECSRKTVSIGLRSRQNSAMAGAYKTSDRLLTEYSVMSRMSSETSITW